MSEPVPDLEIIVTDSTLPLAEVEEFAGRYTVTTAGEVRLSLRWGGPAAGGPEWGGPEIAAIIVVGELLRRSTSDAYDLVKAFVVDVFSRIRTQHAARTYTDGALALAVDSDNKALRLLFCLPESLDASSLKRRIRLMEDHKERLLAEWSAKPWTQPREDGRVVTVKLCWSEEEAKWVECQPRPDGETGM